MIVTPRTLIALLAVASWSIAPQALSQDAAPPAGAEETMPPESATAPTTAEPIEEKKLDQFADAYVAVQDIQANAAVKLEAASTPEEADQVKAEAESSMIAAVERTGLQVPEFNQIVESMASDMEVRSRVAAKLEERSGATAPQQ